MRKVSAMLHVADVAATADWYESIGFDVRDRGSDGEEIVFALLACGDSEVILNAGGKPSTEWRRDADLYVHVDDVEEICTRLHDRVEIVKELHDTF